MELLGVLLSIVWLALIICLRGAGSRGMQAMACIESLGWTMVLSFAMVALSGRHFSILVGTFFVYSMVLGIIGTGAFLFLALLPTTEPPEEGIGLTRLKGE